MRKGRFTQPASDLARKFSESVSYDRRLYQWDIEGSLAHAEALAAASILSSEELDKMRQGLRQIAQEIEAGTFEWKDELEDVHMNIEAALTARIGPTGAKLHTGRSRNDQIALDLRLYVKHEIDGLTKLIKTLQRALVEVANARRDVVMPGYTHLQRAQPIFLAHYLLAHVEAFDRDVSRLKDCRTRTDVLSLGAGALRLNHCAGSQANR